MCSKLSQSELKVSQTELKVESKLRRKEGEKRGPKMMKLGDFDQNPG